MGYGKSKYGSEQKFQKTGKPGKGPGNNFFRIMPAMHSLADEGKWALYFTTHWGYAGISPGDPTKTVVRPFRCIEDKDRRSGMVRQACPECDNFRAQEAEAAAYEAALKAETKDGKPKYTADEIKTAMKSRADWLQAHGPERKWYINVMYKDRTFGDYKINHKTHKKGIDAKIAELWDNQQIDATDLDTGVWFNIKRLGDGFTVPDVVEVEMVQGEKKGSFEISLAPLTEEEKARGLKECRDLSTLGGTVLTEDQIQRLVDSDGSPEAVDAIFGARPSAAPREQVAPATVSKAAGAAKEQVEKFTAKLKETVKETAPVDAVAAVASSATAQAAAQAALLARAAKAKANLKAKADAEAAAKAAADKAAAEAAAPAVNPLEMDDESFLAFFNSQQAAQS